MYEYLLAFYVRACGGQKRVLDPLKLGVTESCEPPGWCWEPNLGPLQEEQVLSILEPALQPCYLILCSPC